MSKRRVRANHPEPPAPPGSIQVCGGEINHAAGPHGRCDALGYPVTEKRKAGCGKVAVVNEIRGIRRHVGHRIIELPSDGTGLPGQFGHIEFRQNNRVGCCQPRQCSLQVPAVAGLRGLRLIRPQTRPIPQRKNRGRADGVDQGCQIARIGP